MDPGVIAAKPPHFMTPEERANKMPDVRSLVIDIGASSDQEARERFSYPDRRTGREHLQNSDLTRHTA